METDSVSLSEDDRQIVLGALDTLGCALADRSHTWTEGEREIYEQALQLLGVIVDDDYTETDSTV